ncbi:hypothetical protein VTJ04DRAFT_4994 [Mycothermus thermophilus]|uniref:uncharacterized protein n=1 Tax=Humicola insolens TaxID=85995 RepID=UPI003743C638
MWQRFKIVQHNSDRELQVAHPLDDDSIRVGLGIGFGAVGGTPKGYSYSIKGGPAPSRPPREFFGGRFETSAPIKEPPLRNPARLKIRTTKVRPPSSIYSDDSPPLDSSYTATVATAYGYRYGGADEISPPSSPEPDARAAHVVVPGDVSPIDEDDGGAAYMYKGGIPPTDHTRLELSHSYVAHSPPRPNLPSQQDRNAQSIPAMRRERRRQSDAAAREAHANQRSQSANRSQNDVPRDTPRYDPLTGGQNSGAQSRPYQSQPTHIAQGMGVSATAYAEPQTSPTSAPTSSFGDRVRRIAKKATAAKDNGDPAAGAFTSTRPMWRGASGRTAIVEPVRDDPNAPPLKIPEKSSRRIIPTGLLAKKSVNPADATARSQTPPVSPPPGNAPARAGVREVAKNQQPAPQSQQPTLQSQSRRHASQPLTGNPVSNEAPAVAAARELVRDGQFASPTPSPKQYMPSPDTNKAVRRKPPPVVTNSQGHQHQQSLSSVYSHMTEVPHPSPKMMGKPALAAEAEEPYVQPPSRFSISTFETSTTATTRQDTEDPAATNKPSPVPSLPNSWATAQRNTDKQQQQTPKQHPAITRAQEQAQAQDSSSTSRATTPVPSDKALPPAPPEQSAESAKDRVALLEAQLRALANRRININRSIKQMTELMPADRLMDSAEVARKRQQEKQKVEALRQELADIQRDEYELGLKLHRAYKRLDREGEWEGTTLWVRRVTG